MTRGPASASRPYRTSRPGSFAGNVHYREGAQWKSIDPTLIAAAPAEQGKGFGWRMKSNGFNVLAKRTLEDGYLRTDVLGRQLQFSLRGAQPVPAAVRGSHIAYADALPDVDLRYVVHPEGVKEQLLLKSEDAPSRFTFTLDTPARDRPPRGGAAERRLAVAKNWPEHNVLSVPGWQWSIAVNDGWVAGHIANHRRVYLASPTKGNLVQTSGKYAGQETVYAREVRQFQSAGYTRQGDWMIPPP